MPNGVTTNASYDAANQLTALNYAKGSTLLGDLGYGYDAAGQLTDRSGSWASTPLPTATTNAGTVDANHRLTAFNGQALSYDVHGNLIDDGLNQYHYDARDQLVEIKQGAITKAAFAYDTFGRRLSKTTDGATTTYRYDGANPIEETSNGQTRAIFSGAGIDERYARDDANGREYFLTDHLGSTVALSNSNGDLTSRYTYEPYGETTAQTLQGAASTNPFQYTGRENDGGLYFYRARYYSSAAKRFISEDPLGLGGGLNAYAYVGGNPLLRRDPYGLFWMPGDPLPQELVDFAAGTGDEIVYRITFGAGDLARTRKILGFDGADECSDSYFAGRNEGAAIVAITATVAFLPEGLGSGATRIVTRWGPEGSWVMTGGNSIRNWIMSGSAESYALSNSATLEVFADSLSFPTGWQWWKGLLGQRRYFP